MFKEKCNLDDKIVVVNLRLPEIAREKVSLQLDRQPNTE